LSSRLDLAQLIPAWLELASRAEVSLGLDAGEAFARANELLEGLLDDKALPGDWTPSAENVEVLHALSAIVCREADGRPEDALGDLEAAFRFIATRSWPAEEYGGPGELLSRCALSGWRLARRFANPPVVKTWTERVLANGDVRAAAERAIAAPIADRSSRVGDLKLEDPEVLLCVCEILHSRLDTAPSPVRDEAEFFYCFLDKPARPIGIHDEREYFLGELSLTAGTASRILFRIAEAKVWFQRAEANVALVQNANAHRARVAYQRLALMAEEQRFQEVLKLAPLWAATFRRLEMVDDAIKCRFLEATAHYEAGNLRGAIGIYLGILEDVNRAGNTRLAAQALTNLARLHADLGETEAALSFAQNSLPLLQQLGSQVHLVKLRWGMGELLRKQNKRGGALEAYRQALTDAAELGMRGDVAALHLVIADLLLEAGQEAQAEWEIRAALPIIDEEKMVPEGIAALSLLRESLRRRQIDKQALRELHRYFQEK
jgi:tetratricopeptide (TPR) repeat protein